MPALFSDHTFRHYAYLRDSLSHLVPALRVGEKHLLSLFLFYFLVLYGYFNSRKLTVFSENKIIHSLSLLGSLPLFCTFVSVSFTF